MAAKIKSIQISAFRGIPELHIPIQGKSLLIKGDNGTGKSSIVEAFEFFFTGSLSRLEGTRGISLARHCPHVTYQASDVRVSIAFDPGNVSLSRTMEAQPSPPSQLSKYLGSAQTGTFILRRSQILEFILTKPAERFRALASIIGVEPLDEIELEIMRARDDLHGEVTAKGLSVDRLLGALSSDLEGKIQTADEILPALNRILKTAELPLINSLDDVEAHAQEMLKAAKGASSADLILSLNRVLQRTREAIVSDQFIPAVKSLSEQVESLVRENAHVELRRSELLKTSRKVIEDEQLDTCPVCGQDIDRQRVLAAIDKRMQTLQALSARASNVRKDAVALISEFDQAKQQISELVDLQSNIADLEIESLSDLSQARALENVPILIRKASNLQLLIPLGEIQEQVKQLQSAWDDVRKQIKERLDQQGLTGEEKKVLDVVRLIGSATDKAAQVSKESRDQQHLRAMLKRAEEIYDTFSSTKKQKVAEIYEEIQTDVQDFYSMLHPDDPHTDVELRLSSRQRASTVLRMKSFEREDEDPRALTSEGHLDSLGLCIFLAFVRTFNKDCPLIILDDVVTTIDSHHRSRICDLLFSEFKEYQLVITTHDGIWYDELRAAQRAYRLDAKYINLEINGWDVHGGPKVEKFPPRIDRIRRKIDNNDKTGAGNDARQYLEWTLKQIIQGTNAPVPINNWLEGTVQALQPHAKKRFASLVIDDAYVESVQFAFGQLEKTVLFANLLSHDNVLAAQVSIVEVAAFFDAVLGIHALVSCQKCSATLKYFRDLKEYRCPNTRCESSLVWSTR